MDVEFFHWKPCRPAIRGCTLSTHGPKGVSRKMQSILVRGCGEGVSGTDGMGQRHGGEVSAQLHRVSTGKPHGTSVVDDPGAVYSQLRSVIAAETELVATSDRQV